MMTKECKFVAAQKLYNLYNCVSADAVACQLTVQPNGTVFRRSLGDNIVFTCSLDLPAGSVIVNIQWLNSQKVEILDKSPGRDKYNSILSGGNISAIELLLRTDSIVAGTGEQGEQLGCSPTRLLG